MWPPWRMIDWWWQWHFSFCNPRIWDSNLRRESGGFGLASTIPLIIQANHLTKCASHPIVEFLTNKHQSRMNQSHEFAGYFNKIKTWLKLSNLVYFSNNAYVKLATKNFYWNATISRWYQYKITDDTHMTSMKIANFSRPPTPLIQTNPPPSPL